MNQNDKVRMPGFTAQSSLYESSKHYHRFATLVDLSGSNTRQVRVEPMLRFDPCDAAIDHCLGGDPFGCLYWGTNC